MSNLEVALEYLLKYKFSVIPFKQNKKGSLIDTYKEYQGRLPTEDEVREWWTKWPNAMIGVITGPVSDLMALDFDWYKLREPEKAPLIELVPLTIPGPICISPEGGHHRLFRYSENGTVINSTADILKGFDIRALKGVITMPPSVNESGLVYRWMGGRGLSEAPLASLNKDILNNILILIKSKGGVAGFQSNNNKSYQSITNHNIILDYGKRDETMFHIANCLVKGGMKKEDIFKMLEITAERCNPPFEAVEIPAKIESAFKRARDKERNISDEIREFVGITNGFFNVSTVAESISFHNKAQIRVALHRFSNRDGILEKDPKRDGWFRKVEKIEETNWQDVEIKRLNVFYPFGIESLVYTLPKSIVVVAGTSDAGKTAFLLNLVDKNCEKFKIHYFSSEMGPMEIKDRISKFGYPEGFWRDKFHFYERSSSFAQVIKPDDINIIDYLEIEDFTQVAVLIRDIFDKLTTGMCVIAIQKKRGTDLGRGGELTMEKARLYVSMDHGKITIAKAKNWKTEVNPNGLFRTFKLVQGHKFTDVSKWDKTIR